MYFGIHFVYDRPISIRYYTLLLLGSYSAMMFIVAVRAAEPFWRAMRKLGIYTVFLLLYFSCINLFASEA